MSDLGDLTEFMKEGSGGPVNLNWLDVNEQDYRELDTLPKQNLDAVPDLVAQWSHEGNAPGIYFVPNRDEAGYPKDPKFPQAPHTMGDMSQMHGPIHTDKLAAAEAEAVHRTARIALLQSTDLRQWQGMLKARFARDTLVRCKTILASVLAERGLLGKLYIDAEDFPGCGKSAARLSSQVVKRYAGEAKFVKAKTACGDCSHRVQMGSAHHCGVFHKQIVQDVPYSETLADKIEQEQQARGVQARSQGTPKERIKTAYLGEAAAPQRTFSGQDNTGAVIPASRLLRKGSDIQAQQAAIEESKARPIVSMLRRELLKGRSAEEIAKGLRLAFDARDLGATKQYWGPLYKEAGLYGTIYSTQDSFDDCRVGADFLSKHGSKVRGIVAGDKCTSCIFSKVGRCMLYGRKLVAAAEDLYTPETVAAVLDEHKMAGQISPHLVKQQWGNTPREALQAIHKQAAGADITRVMTDRMDIQGAFYGTTVQRSSSELARRAIIKKASKLLNEGLYGDDLRMALQADFDPRDIVATAADLKVLFAEQGLQGIYFVDPSVYDDYGHGCKEAQRLHRSRQAVKYAKVGDKCATCVHQTRIGYCSVLNKNLVIEPPYTDKKAQQQAVLASGRAIEIDYNSLVNNGATMLQEFELTGGSGDIDLNSAGLPFEASIQFGNNEIDTTKL